MGYAFRLAARVLLYSSSHRQDNTHHGLCYTSRGALAGTTSTMNAVYFLSVMFYLTTDIPPRTHAHTHTHTPVSVNLIMGINSLSATVSGDPYVCGRPLWTSVHNRNGTVISTGLCTPVRFDRLELALTDILTGMRACQLPHLTHPHGTLIPRPVFREKIIK